MWLESGWKKMTCDFYSWKEIESEAFWKGKELGPVLLTNWKQGLVLIVATKQPLPWAMSSNTTGKILVWHCWVGCIFEIEVASFLFCSK